MDNLENRPLSITESEPGEQPETSRTFSIDMPGVGVVSASGDGSPVSCAPGGEGAAGQDLPRDPAGSVDEDLSAKKAATDETLAADDAIRPLEFTEVIVQLDKIVHKAHPTSALTGLKITAAAFGALLDIYAAPNSENPAGMCDDLDAFRRLFAQIIAGGAR